jgi:hypothetical protein
LSEVFLFGRRSGFQGEDQPAHPVSAFLYGYGPIDNQPRCDIHINGTRTIKGKFAIHRALLSIIFALLAALAGEISLLGS